MVEEGYLFTRNNKYTAVDLKNIYVKNLNNIRRLTSCYSTVYE